LSHHHIVSIAYNKSTVNNMLELNFNDLHFCIQIFVSLVIRTRLQPLHDFHHSVSRGISTHLIGSGQAKKLALNV